MNQDKNNFNSDDLQKTMEIPVIRGGKIEPSGGIFDPWNLNSGGQPEEIIGSIAKSIKESDKMPESITISNNIHGEDKTEPDKPMEEVPPPSRENEMPSPSEVTGNEVVVPKTQAEEISLADSFDKTASIPVVAPIKLEETDDFIRKKAKGGRLWPPILASSIFIIIACFVTLTVGIMPVLMQHGFARGMTQIMSPVINAGAPPAYTNVLLVGVDEDGYRTDTMMVATYDIENEKVYIMQLPRDTYVHENGRRDKKLNSAYYSGAEQLRKEIQIAYGIDVHRYIEVNLDGFRQLIDAIGGVEIDVPITMIYDDPTQNFHIYLKKGFQRLDGKKAEQFVRFRKNNDGTGYPMGDLQRMEAQKNFIMATFKQMISIDGLSNINELIKIAQNNVKTDLTFDEIYNYCTTILTLEEGKIEFISAPGAPANLPGGSYFVVDYDGARNVAQNYFYSTSATMAKMKRIVVKPAAQEESPKNQTDSGDDNDLPVNPQGTNQTTNQGTKPTTGQGANQGTKPNTQPGTKPNTKPTDGGTAATRPSGDDKPQNTNDSGGDTSAPGAVSR